MGLGDECEDGPKSRAAGYAKDVGIRERVAQKSLETCARDGERCSDKDAEDDARQTDVLNDQAVIAGHLAALAEDNAEQIAPKRVKRNGHRAELQGDNDNEKQNDQKKKAVKQELAKCQRLHAQPPMELE